MKNQCSAIEDTGGCKHGHWMTQACHGYGGQPSCTREDLKFDEERKAVTCDTWPVSRRERRAMNEVPNAPGEQPAANEPNKG